MLRKSMLALLAVAAIGILAPEAAMARGGGHGGGMGGGGMHMGGGMGGGFRSAPMGGGGAFRSAAVGNRTVGGGAFRSQAIGGGGFRSAAVARQGFRGGFRHRGFRGAPFLLGAGLAGSYAYYDGYDPYYSDQYVDGSGCYIVRERVHTRYGWRVRPVQVCG